MHSRAQPNSRSTFFSFVVTTTSRAPTIVRPFAPNRRNVYVFPYLMLYPVCPKGPARPVGANDPLSTLTWTWTLSALPEFQVSIVAWTSVVELNVTSVGVAVSVGTASAVGAPARNGSSTRHDATRGARVR